MLMDHEAGRAHVSVMAAMAGQATPWTAQDRASAISASRGYADLLRGHIRKEDQILYPMARMRLHEEALARVDRECAAFELRQVEAGADALKDLGRNLVERHVGIAA
jgi:hemerythrin-like domain-containing protein